MSALKSLLFKGWELDLAIRYLPTKRKNGGIAVIAILSYVGVALAVTALIAVMSVMNGFQEEIMGRFLTFNSHADITGPAINDIQTRDAMLSRLRAVPGVTEAGPYVESSALAEGERSSLPVSLHGGDVDSLKQAGIGKALIEGSLDTYASGDAVLIGQGVANMLDLKSGDQISVTVQGAQEGGYLVAVRRAYTVAVVFSAQVSKIDQAYVYMSLTEAQDILGRGARWDRIEVRLRAPYRIEHMIPELTNAAGAHTTLEDWKCRDSVI